MRLGSKDTFAFLCQKAQIGFTSKSMSMTNVAKNSRMVDTNVKKKYTATITKKNMLSIRNINL